MPDSRADRPADSPAQRLALAEARLQEALRADPQDQALIGRRLIERNTLKGAQAGVSAKAKPKMTEMRIGVIRCRCGNPASHRGVRCPQGVADPTAERILRRYRNPFRQLLWERTGH